MHRSDYTDAHSDLDLLCLQIAYGPFLCIAHHLRLGHNTCASMQSDQSSVGTLDSQKSKFLHMDMQKLQKNWKKDAGVVEETSFGNGNSGL